MKFIVFALTILLASQVELKAQSVFIPENGNYQYDLADIAEALKGRNVNYITLKNHNPNLKYKLIGKKK